MVYKGYAPNSALRKDGSYRGTNKLRADNEPKWARMFSTALDIIKFYAGRNNQSTIVKDDTHTIIDRGEKAARFLEAISQELAK